MSVVREWYKEQNPNRYVPEFEEVVVALEKSYAEFERVMEQRVFAATKGAKRASASALATHTCAEVLTELKPDWEQRCAELIGASQRLNRIYWQRIGIPVLSLSAEEHELLLLGELDANRMAVRRDADLRRAMRAVFFNPLRWPIFLISWATSWGVRWGYADVVRVRVSWSVLERRIEHSPRKRLALLCDRFQRHIDEHHRLVMFKEHR